MTGTPGFFTAGRWGEACREDVQLLMHIFDGELVVPFMPNNGLEVFLNVCTNDKDHLAKAGAFGVEDGIVDDGFLIRADDVELFQAAIA